MKTVVAAAAFTGCLLAAAAVAQIDERDPAAQDDAEPVTVVGNVDVASEGFPRAAALEDGEPPVDDAEDEVLPVERARAAERTEAPGADAAATETDEAGDDAAAATTVGGPAIQEATVRALEAQRAALEELTARLEALETPAEDAAEDDALAVGDDVEPIDDDLAMDEVQGEAIDESAAADDEEETAAPPPLTPSDFTLRSDPHQSKDPVEVQATEEVRAAVASDAELSDPARGVYITTLNGIVELRGEVPTVRERGLVEDRVRALVGDRFDVSNLLTVRDRD